MRKESIKTLVFCGFLSSCATAPSEPPTPIAQVPTCASQTECDLKWSAARAFVLAHSPYKFQTYTNDFMETYSPVAGAVELGARVNREPAGNGESKIVASFWCDNVFGCHPDARKTLDEFNRIVNSIK